MSEESSFRDEFAARMGKFFIFLSFVLFLLFSVSDQAGRPDFDYFFSSVISLAFGLYLRRKVPKPPPPERFRLLRNWREKRKEKKLNKPFEE